MRLKFAILFLAMLALAQAAPSPTPPPTTVVNTPTSTVAPLSNTPKNDKVQVPPTTSKAAVPLVAQVPPSKCTNKPAEVKPTESKKPEEPKKDEAKKTEQPKPQTIDNKKSDEHKKDEPYKGPENKKLEVLANRGGSHKPDDHRTEEAHHQEGKRRGYSDEDDGESDEDDNESDEDNSESGEDGSDEDDDDITKMSTFELEQHVKHEIQLRYQNDIEQIMKFVFRLTDLKNHKDINQHLFEVSPSEATLKCVAPMFERMISSVSTCEHAADEHVKAIEIAYRKLHPEEHKERNHRPEKQGEHEEEHRRLRRSEPHRDKNQKGHSKFHREHKRKNRSKNQREHHNNNDRQENHGEYDRRYDDSRNDEEHDNDDRQQSDEEYERDHRQEHQRGHNRMHRPDDHEEQSRNGHRQKNHREHDRSQHDTRDDEEYDRNGRPQYHGDHERDHREEYHRKFDRNRHDDRNHEDDDRKGRDRIRRPMHQKEHDRDHYEVREHGNENHREEKHHGYGDARRDKHGIPCRDHHEDEMRMAHEIFVGQCFINSLVATRDKVSNHSILDKAKMKQGINMTLLTKANKDKAVVDLQNCLAAPRDVTHLVEMMAGVKHFTTRMISPMVSALYNNQQPSMSMIVQGQSKLMDIKNNLYNLKGIICLVESLAKNGCGAVVTRNMPQGRH